MQNKKALIMLGIAIIFIIFVLIIVFLPSKSSPSISDQPLPTPIKTGTNLPGNSGQSLPEQSFYQNSLYRINFPQVYYARPTSVDGNLDGVLLEGDSDTLPKVEIQVYTAGQDMVDRISGILKSLGFTEQNLTTASGYRALKFTSSAGNGNKFQEDAVVISANGRVYKIHLTYVSDVKNEEVERDFDNMISTFKLL